MTRPRASLLVLGWLIWRPTWALLLCPCGNPPLLMAALARSQVADPDRAAQRQPRGLVRMVAVGPGRWAARSGADGGPGGRAPPQIGFGRIPGARIRAGRPVHSI